MIHHDLFNKVWSSVQTILTRNSKFKIIRRPSCAMDYKPDLEQKEPSQGPKSQVQRRLEQRTRRHLERHVSTYQDLLEKQKRADTRRQSILIVRQTQARVSQLNFTTGSTTSALECREKHRTSQVEAARRRNLAASIHRQKHQDRARHHEEVRHHQAQLRRTDVAKELALEWKIAGASARRQRVLESKCMKSRVPFKKGSFTQTCARNQVAHIA